MKSEGKRAPIENIGRANGVRKMMVGRATVGGKHVQIFLAQPSGSPIINIDDRWYRVGMDEIVRDVVSFDTRARTRKKTLAKRGKKTTNQ